MTAPRHAHPDLALPLSTRRAIWGSAAAFAVTVGAALFALLMALRQDVIDDGDAQVQRLAQGASAAINRTLLSIDLPLTDVAATLPASTGHASGFDLAQAQLDLARVTHRHLMVRHLALIDMEGGVWADNLGLPVGQRLALPAEFLQQLRAAPASTLVISTAQRSPTLFEPVLYFARPVIGLNATRAAPATSATSATSATNTPRAAVISAVAIALLEEQLLPGGDVAGTEVALRRQDGAILASVPTATLFGGAGPAGAPAPGPTQAPAPSGAPAAVGNGTAAPNAGRARSPVGGEPASVATQATLIPGLQVVAATHSSALLAHWSATRNAVVVGAALFMALLALAAWRVQRHLAGMARARAELAATAATLEQALASMHDGFLLCDAQDRVRVWNERYLHLFPWLVPVMRVGLPFRELAEAAAEALLVHGSDAERREWVEQRLAHRHQGRVVQQRVGANQATVHTIERRTNDGGMVSVHRDSTLIERELSQLKEAAEAANEAKSRFLATVSHEIRTPLNAVLGLNGLMLAGELQPAQRAHAKLIRSSGQNLLALINDILDLSKIEAGRLELERVDFDPGQALAETVAMLLPRAQAKGLGLHLSLPPDLPQRLRGDPGRLRQLLLNLVGNALKFTDHGQVEVAVLHQPKGDRHCELTLRISDTGVGIAAEALPQMFEPFSQADSSTARRFGGTGLGLAISRQLAELMGGRILASSTLGQGSVFTACVLLAPAAPAADAMHAAAAAHGMHAAPPADAAFAAGTATRQTHEPPLPAQVPLRILVAEDNAVNQILIKAMLDHLGHHSDLVADGHEALSQVHAAPYDLVLMDIQMPQMDGSAATLAIRALPAPLGAIPIVAMTANAMADERAAYAAAGMNGFIAKPIDLHALAEVLGGIGR